MAPAHACTGLAVGAVTLPLAAAVGLPQDVPSALGWVAAWGGAALLPDFDQGAVSWRRGFPRPTGSSAATMWGPVSVAAARLVGRAAGGHRWGTHDPLLAPLVFGLLAWAAALHPASAVVAVAVVVGAALRACHVVVPGRLETTVVGNALLSWTAAWLLVDATRTDLGWLPFAVAGGVAVHVAGDWLTVGGVPLPLATLRRSGRRRRTALGLFRTGHPVESLLTGVSSVVALGFLALHLVPVLS